MIVSQAFPALRRDGTGEVPLVSVAEEVTRGAAVSGLRSGRA
jgi:hypothetical protein